MESAGRKPIELVINLNDGIKYFRSRILESWPDLSKDFDLTLARQKIRLPDGSTMADLGHLVSWNCRFLASDFFRLDGLPEPTSQVMVQSINSSPVSVPMHPDYTFGALKRIYSEKQGIPIDQLSLIFAGRHWGDAEYLRNSRISSKSVIHCVVGLRSHSGYSDIITSPSRPKDLPAHTTVIGPDEEIQIPVTATLGALLMRLGCLHDSDHRFISIAEDKHRSLDRCTLIRDVRALQITVVVQPPLLASLLVRQVNKQIQLFPGETVFELQLRLYESRVISTPPFLCSVWHGMEDSGDGVTVGTIAGPEVILYEEARTLPVNGPMFAVDMEADSSKLLARRHEWEDENSKQILSRLNVAQQLFETFLDKQAASDYPHKVGLVTFGSKVEILQPLTSLFDQFRRHLAKIEASGDTAMRDCIKTSAQKLISIRTAAGGKFDAAKMRIVVLTDGVDNVSTIGKTELISFLKGNNIVVDGVVVGDEGGKELREITFASGGLCFSPGNVLEQIQIGELEPFLRLTEREYAVPENYALKLHRLAFDQATGPTRPRRRQVIRILPGKRIIANRAGAGGRNAGLIRLMSEFQAVRDANHQVRSNSLFFQFSFLIIFFFF